MRTSISRICIARQVIWLLTLPLLFLLVPESHAEPRIPVNRSGTNEDFSVLGNAIVQLLQSHDTARFAKMVSPTFEDWQAIYSTNAITHDPDALKNFRESAANQRQRVEQSAKQLLATADALHLDFSKTDLHFQIIPPKWLGSTHYPTLQAENDDLAWSEKVEVILSTNAEAGDYKLTIRNLIKFPGGWRSFDGAQWLSFPANEADEKTKRELALKDKASGFQGITEKDDPALLKLAAALVDFVRAQDVTIFQQRALVAADTIWAQIQNNSHAPPRKEFDEMWKEREEDLLSAARAAASQMEVAGIDFKNAEIKVTSAALERLEARGAWGGTLSGDQFSMTLAVKSEGKSKTGQSLSGNYVLAVDEIERFGEDWKVTGKVRWDKLPSGIVDEKVAAALEFENYVAKYRSLPPGTAAPEIEFTRLDNGNKMKLSDLRGKVVLLDFWATWCGPCQAPMARLQTLRQTHPDWQDQVAIVPLSIDDTTQILRAHLEKRGWTNTFNVWAGDGGWSSVPAKTFRVTAVPTTYLIDQQSRIVGTVQVDSGRSEVEDQINQLLKKAKRER